MRQHLWAVIALFGGALTVVAIEQFADGQPAVAVRTQPKYGPTSTRLFRSRQFIQQTPAPDFWALVPYYLPQLDDVSCSVATVAMVVNALRVDHDLAAEDELATHAGVLQRVNSEVWNRGVAPDGEGVTLDQLADILRQALPAYGLTDYEVEVVHADDSPRLRAELHQALLTNEQSDDDLLVINFLQSAFTGDPNGAVGHFAPVAAYDRDTRRVLIFDPDRRWYEPYWVSEATLLAGMATRDADAGRTRGYLWIRRSDKR